jgi:hypothetical protein
MMMMMTMMTMMTMMMMMMIMKKEKKKKKVVMMMMMMMIMMMMMMMDDGNDDVGVSLVGQVAWSDQWTAWGMLSYATQDALKAATLNIAAGKDCIIMAARYHDHHREHHHPSLLQCMPNTGAFRAPLLERRRVGVTPACPSDACTLVMPARLQRTCFWREWRAWSPGHGSGTCRSMPSGHWRCVP